MARPTARAWSRSSRRWAWAPTSGSWTGSWAGSSFATWVEAADIFLAPYLDLDRVTSGTLSYAMGAGKAVVASPFAYAKERLTRGRGMLVAPGAPDLLAEAVIKFLGDRKLRDGYGAKAYEATRDQVWSATGAAYGRIFTRVARPSHRPSPPVRRLSPAGR